MQGSKWMCFASVLIAWSAHAQVEGVAIDRIGAANVAQAIAAEATSATVDVDDSGSSSAAKMQEKLDEIASIASALDVVIRSGAEKAATLPLYRDLRRARLEALGLAMTGEIAISPEDAALFESLMGDLDRYYEQ